MSEFPADFRPQFPMVIDSTMRSDFVACPHQFFEAYILKRALRGSSVDLTAGAAYAKGLQVVRHLVWGPEHLSPEAALRESIIHTLAEYGELAVPAGKEHKSPARVIGALVAYFDHYKPAADHIQPYIKKNGEPACEFTFSIPTNIRHPDTGDPILYCGRTDLVGVYNDTLWIVDDKTASQLGDSWARSWRLRGQLTGYCFAAHALGLQVSGAIVRGISFLKSGAYGFSEPIEYRTNFQLERWWYQLHRDLARMVACWEEKTEEYPYGYWDWNLADSCNSYGGCPFMSLCTVANPDEWAGDYEYRDWNPLDLNPVGRSNIVSSFSS